MRYEIGNGVLAIVVDTLGAELVSVKKDGKEREWQNENGSWAGHAPVLFPVCGHCGVKVDGKSYPIGPHGFAKKKEFSLLEKNENSLAFVLVSDEDTKTVYPFSFRFFVKYSLDGDKLSIAYTFVNEGDEPAYAAFGGHDSFALEEDVDGYALCFEKEEKFDNLMHEENGYLTGEIKPFGEGTKLPLPKNFLMNGATLIFGNIRSRKVTLEKTDGTQLAEISFDGFSNLLLWRPEGAKMICIEPWHNLPDKVGVEDVEFSKKAGIIKIDKEKTFVRTIRYL